MSLTKWLTDQNYKIAENVSLGGKLPDLIGYNEHEIVAFEEKRYAEELSNAIGQCLHYLNDSNKVFVVLTPKEIERVHPNTFEILKRYGIGLLEKEPKFAFALTEMGKIEQHEVGRAKLCVLKRGKR